MTILPHQFRPVAWCFSEAPNLFVKKKKKEQSDSQHDNWATELGLQVNTQGKVLCQASTSSWSQEAVPWALHPIKSFGEKGEGKGAESKSLASKFSRGQGYSKRENQSGCFSISISLLEKDHTEWASVTKHNCENKMLAGKKGVSRKVRRAYLEVVHLIFPGNSWWASNINQGNASKHSLSLKIIYYVHLRPAWYFIKEQVGV